MLKGHYTSSLRNDRRCNLLMGFSVVPKLFSPILPEQLLNKKLFSRISAKSSFRVVLSL